MIEYDEFPMLIWNDIEDHFAHLMQMRCVDDFDYEKTFKDDHITMVITIGSRASVLKKDGHFAIRLVIKTCNNGKRFSLTNFFEIDGKGTIIEFIYNMVKYDGGSNSDILEEWKKIKKTELRDIKLNKLGL